MNGKKLFSGITAACLLSTALVGCGSNNAGTVELDESVINPKNMEKGEITYPMQTDETIKYWVRLPNSISTVVTNYGETEFAKENMKRTGVQVEYVHPAQGMESENFNTMLASGELPDIIEYNWLDQNPDAQIESEIIFPLNTFFNDYAPNLKKWLDANPDVTKQLKTDSGNFYAFPFIRNDQKLLSTSGFMLRGDWLKELGLEVPETIDEWTEVLTAFKEKKGAVSPYVSNPVSFMCAYGLINSFYINDGNVCYGYYQPELKDYLTKMNEWYNAGLLPKDFDSKDGNQANNEIMNHQAGSLFGAGGGSMGTLLNAMKEKGEAFDLTATKFPTNEKGKTPEIGNKQFQYSPANGAAITRQAKNPVLAARFLDYSYSEEGAMLNNFGIEGTSYDMKDGYPTFSDVITKNPQKLSMGQAIPLYARSANEGPFVQDVRYIEQYYQLDNQKDALVKWSDNNDLDHRIPQITLTSDESDEKTAIMTDIDTYCSEQVIKFIKGEKSLDEFDAFITELKNMGIERAIELEQAAYDRFINRK